MTKILVGVTGSIAAYKTPELLRSLINAECEVKTVVTEAGQSFVTPITLQALSGSDVYTLLLDTQAEAAMSHIQLARWPDLLLIAPASANFIAKLAHGFCDDLLSTICMATAAPIIVVPAMNKHMWANMATQANINQLKMRNIRVLGPENGVQACGDIGLGRMMEVNEIVKNILALDSKPLLQGINILITAGSTQEMIDPVRFISNRSSGKMGYALAQEASRLGAQVTLISGTTTINTLPNCKQLIKVNSASEMLSAVEAQITNNQIFISCAAVSDYRVLNQSSQKIKRQQQNITLTLEPNIDILAKIASQCAVFTVGFAAETENLLVIAKNKLLQKKVNLMIANDVSDTNIGFDSNNNEVYIVSHDNTIKLDFATKSEIAKQLLQYIYQFYAATQ
ncbi:MAG: bifunctional phosphopantothenoylcysteine decarboxylase/phosphopantothenate--cysteine ligase CoaBC [Burkholderiales bacterium]|nr:bifunctional phosphopantothenoylcysteine decarboxylase/phosphopantothenate--cysteine ligase CoaBC [Burkholderiales bacterium]